MNRYDLPAGDADNILKALAEAVRIAEAAALSGRIGDLENASSRQIELCRQLGGYLELKKICSTPLCDTGPEPAARRLHSETKVFSAVLRRLRANFEILKNTAQGSSAPYQPDARGAGWRN